MVCGEMTKQQEKELVMMTNLYFIFMEAADSILYRTEEYFDAQEERFRRECFGERKMKNGVVVVQESLF